MKIKNMTITKYHLLLTIVIINGSLILASATPPLENDWKIKVGTEFSFNIITDHNSLNNLSDPILENFVQDYHFDNLDNDFFGQPAISLNITSINTSVEISEIVDNIIDFSFPIELDQKIDGIWHPKNNMKLPLCVPVGHWEELKDAFESKVDSITFTETGTSEMMYTFSFISNSVQCSITYYWDKNDGSLQALYYAFQSVSYTETLQLALSGLNKPDKWDSAFLEFLNSTNILLLLPIPVVLLLGMVSKIFRRKSKVKTGAESQVVNYSSATFGDVKFEGERSPEVNTEDLPVDPNWESKFNSWKQKYLIRWFLMNGLSIAVLVIGLKILNSLGNSLEDENPMIITIIVGIALVGVFTGIMNYPLLKINKNITLGTNRQFLGDVSPFLTLVMGIIGLLCYSLIFDSAIASLQGKVVVGIFILVIIGLFGFIYWFYPWKLLDLIKKKAKIANYQF